MVMCLEEFAVQWDFWGPESKREIQGVEVEWSLS